ncbi:hypothetical protein [Thalassobacterium maritimum]|uniref:hypothetical protein n=1 Tax=Thalassobacterium maritimum TaxID=3041265 RepID=UPI002810D2C5|nr:hypothetical protein [Coraliomargarita sp. SDUM461003]
MTSFSLSGTALGAIRIFSASDFPTAWDTVEVSSGPSSNPDGGGGGSASVSVAASGGNPGSYLNINLNVNGGYRIVTSFSFLPSFVHTPSTQGAINSLDYSFDTRRGGSTSPGNAQAYGLGIEQNGIHYYTYYADSITSWQTISETLIEADDFFVDGANTDEAAIAGAATPDFSASGSAITFGYWRGNSTTVGSAYAEGYMDNYNVTLDYAPVPEPSQVAWALGIVSLCVVMIRRRH